MTDTFNLSLPDKILGGTDTFNLSEKVVHYKGNPKFIPVPDVKTFIQEDYKNTVLAKRGEISWQEYARRREKLAGEELSK